MTFRIVSGGQTGVDRAALDAAIKLGIRTGGWCPQGRLAEDGAIQESYPLKETDSPDYEVRTEWNVRDSDGTLILCDSALQGGTLLTLQLAERLRKPHKVIRFATLSPHDCGSVQDWLVSRQIRVLNVAGPRESTAPGIYDRAFAFLHRLLSQFER